MWQYFFSENVGNKGKKEREADRVVRRDDRERGEERGRQEERGSASKRTKEETGEGCGK